MYTQLESTMGRPFRKVRECTHSVHITTSMRYVQGLIPINAQLEISAHKLYTFNHLVLHSLALSEHVFFCFTSCYLDKQSYTAFPFLLQSVFIQHSRKKKHAKNCVCPAQTRVPLVVTVCRGGSHLFFATKLSACLNSSGDGMP